jgi:hypothetical protein
MEVCAIEPTRRAEKLSVEEVVGLARVLSLARG